MEILISTSMLLFGFFIGWFSRGGVSKIDIKKYQVLGQAIFQAEIITNDLFRARFDKWASSQEAYLWARDFKRRVPSRNIKHDLP